MIAFTSIEILTDCIAIVKIAEEDYLPQVNEPTLTINLFYQPLTIFINSKYFYLLINC